MHSLEIPVNLVIWPTRIAYMSTTNISWLTVSSWATVSSPSVISGKRDGFKLVRNIRKEETVSSSSVISRKETGSSSSVISGKKETVSSSYVISGKKGVRPTMCVKSRSEQSTHSLAITWPQGVFYLLTTYMSCLTLSSSESFSSSNVMSVNFGSVEKCSLSKVTRSTSVCSVLESFFLQRKMYGLNTNCMIYPTTGH